MCVSVQTVQAQDKSLNTLLASFAEVNGLMRIKAADILKNTETKLDDALAYEYLWNKDVYLKPEDCNSYPIAYYKMKNDIIIVLFSNREIGTTQEKGAYSINIQSYYNGRFVSKRRALASFTRDGSSSYDIYISKDKQTLTFKDLKKGKKYEQKIKSNGQIIGSN